MYPKDPRVSLVVLAGRQPDRLHPTLRSVAVQTSPPGEILVPATVADAAGVGAHLEVPAGPIRVVRLEDDPAASWVALVNAALRRAGGEFVGFVQAGSRLHPEHLEVLAACVEAGGLPGCYADAQRCEPLADGEACRPVVSVPFEPLELLAGPPIPLETFLFRRAVLLDLGGLDPDCPGDPVRDLLLRMAAQGQKLHHVPRVTVRLEDSGEGAGEKAGRFAEPEAFYARHAGLLSAALVDRLADLRGEREALRRQVEALEAELTEQRRYKRLLADALDARRAALGRLGRRCEELEAANRELRGKCGEVSGQLEAILASRAWRVVQAYARLRHRLRLRVPPSGRRVVKRGFEILEKEGVQGVRRRLTQSVSLGRVDRGLYPFEPVAPEGVALDPPERRLDVSVSVIIPTKNAGAEFQRTLRRIRRQEGVREPEIVVIDSGSSDDTVAVAQAEGARVLQIPPETFHHAETRNQAARHARGEVLVFTVQDASPAGPDWLHRLVGPIVEGRADAVSARQIPRADADLYALVATWGFNRFLGFEQDTLRRGETLQGRPLAEQRRLAHLDSVCLAVPKAVHAAKPFGGRFAEDLELGRRLLEEGHGLLHQVDNAVVHSHTRPARYFFLRSYVDLRSLFGIFRGGQPTPAVALEDALGTLAWAYHIFAQELRAWLRVDKAMAAPPGQAFGRLHTCLEQAFEGGEPREVSTGWDASLFSSFIGGHSAPTAEELLGKLRAQLRGQIHTVSEYLTLRGDWGCDEEEVTQTLHKVFAASAGCALAELGVELPAELVRGI